MKIDARTRWFNRAQNGVTVLLLLAVVIGLAVLSVRFDVTADWTAGARGSLSESSQTLVRDIDEPIRFVAFIGDEPALRERVDRIVDRYRQVESEIELEFIDPDLEPQRSREFGVTQAGEIFVQVGDQREAVDRFTEAGITNALARAARASDRFVVFAQGHGEPDPMGQANHDLGQLGQQLQDQGLQIQRVNIARDGIPDNTAVLVIAGSRGEWLPGEMDRVRRHVADGGHLLWLVDPYGNLMPELADKLGLGLPEATVKDETGQALGIDDPSMVLIFNYGDDSVTEPMEAVTLFPHVTMVDASGVDDWDRQPILSTSRDAWLVDLDGQRLGSGRFDLGMLMTRNLEDEDMEREQRVAVVGSTAFLSNAFIGNGANLELGQRLFNWVSADPVTLSVPVRSAPDRQLDLSRNAYTAIGVLFLMILPGLFLAAGLWVWWRRRR
ncbi:ABC-type uncharacterized transport system involved in gliding motility auxiliary subunit [Natronospira proteinivora]|uniref:ABC-type uncharacterized transport system involved in gliding motility auxiliary subunit n=1 Tax=Natronospira proteinivora TaxID=1807133 RepID=A0ABT1GB43_9GAMM|nr:DUF4350 domain-containing protein [Natronospira proteinivora]MCP1728549.1 ABC-type uncharacterized transport system involved in gliding motility auxiliary subunit [Natronospira proteinivora]